MPVLTSNRSSRLLVAIHLWQKQVAYSQRWGTSVVVLGGGHRTEAARRSPAPGDPSRYFVISKSNAWVKGFCFGDVTVKVTRHGPFMLNSTPVV